MVREEKTLAFTIRISLIRKQDTFLWTTVNGGSTVATCVAEIKAVQIITTGVWHLSPLISLVSRPSSLCPQKKKGRGRPGISYHVMSQIVVNFNSVGPPNMQKCYHCNTEASSIDSRQRLQRRYLCWGRFVSKTPCLPSTQLQGELQGVWLLSTPMHAQLSCVYLPSTCDIIHIPDVPLAYFVFREEEAILP